MLSDLFNYIKQTKIGKDAWDWKDALLLLYLN